ncbi:MAG: UDP-N-acetylmuramate--L-alanine ligase [bacterium]|nr:UDP-N-acetylmuramate--L-alanine ligase [bacterium]
MKKIHFMGIAGSGMNAVAGLAHALDYDISGCDFSDSGKVYAQNLLEQGVPISWEHSESHLIGIDILCVTPSVFDLSSSHPEFLKAKEFGIHIMTWQEFMGVELQKNKKVIAVAGTKGKTTVTSLCGFLFEQSGCDPIVEIGGKLKNWNTNYRMGAGEYFICEADEFNDNFLHYKPQVAVITNLEMDHPEYFSSYEHYIESFVKFVGNISKNGTLIINIDSKQSKDFLSKIDFFEGDIITYGINSDCDYYLKSVNLNLETKKSTFEIITKNKEVVKFTSQLIGTHNGLNILASYIAGDVCGISEGQAFEAIEKFEGVSRRFDLIGKSGGVVVYNDYAHNSMSVKACLDATRTLYPKNRIWAVYQPHMYSRTILQLDEYPKSFESADQIVIMEIFASREKGKPIASQITSEVLVSRIKDAYKDKNIQVRYVKKSEVVDALLGELLDGDVVVNMGAGDNSDVAEDLCKKLIK